MRHNNIHGRVSTRERLGFRTDRKGQTLILLALAFSSMLALLGLIFDGGRLYFERRQMQAAADAATMAALHELRRGYDSDADQVKPAARRDAEINGYSTTDSIVTVNRPAPGLGADSVEVIIERTVPTTFMRVVGRQASIVRARAAGQLFRDVGGPCVIALRDDPVKNTLTVSGNAGLEASCGVWANSPDDEAMSAPSGSQGSITAPWTRAGGYTGSNYNVPSQLTTRVAIADPLTMMADYPAGMASASNQSAPGNNGVRTIQPGRYTQNIRSNGGSLTFAPGLYILERGMTINGGDVFGTGVTFYVIKTRGGSNDTIQISTTGTVQLSAPSKTDIDGGNNGIQGVLFYGARTNPYVNTGHKLGRSTLDSYYNGAIYFPSEHVDWAGNSNTTASYSMIVAETIDITGGAGVAVNQTPTLGFPVDFDLAPVIYKAALVQ